MIQELQIDANGYRIVGRRKLASSLVCLDHVPLIVALHGGGFTSAYYDSPGFSLLDRAAAAGCPAIALDRPGYGSSSRLPKGDRAVPRNAEILEIAIDRLWRERDFDATGIVLMGHSVGGGIVNYMAGQVIRWPLLAIAFSGVLASLPSGFPAFWNDHDRDEWVHTTSEYRKAIMLGPEGSYPPDAAIATDKISTSAWWGEVVDMFTLWPDEFRDVCAKIHVPVRCRVGDHDPSWSKAREHLNLLANAYVNSPFVDVALVPGAGHCIEYHLVGDAFQKEEIAFAIDCAAGSLKSEPTSGARA